MEFKFAVTIVLIILLTICHAQSKGNYQSVGGDFGLTLLKNIQAKNPNSQPGAQNSTSLWSWGGAPKGRMIQNGALVADPYYIWKSLNLTNGWLGRVYTDPKTGYPVYAFIDPYTGSPDYFYVDPKTGNPIYINAGTTSGTPIYSRIPSYLPYVGTPASPLNYPWLGDLSGGLPSYSGINNGGLGTVYA